MNNLKRIYSPLGQLMTLREAAYLLVSLPVGIAIGSILLTLYPLGLGLAIIWIGVFILVGTQVFLRGVAFFERQLANGMIDAEISAPDPRPEPESTAGPGYVRFITWAKSVWTDPLPWRTLGWSTFRFIFAPVVFTIAVLFLTLPISLLVAPAGLAVEWAGIDTHTWIHMYWLGPIAFLVVAPALAWLVRGSAELHRELGRWALGPGNRD